MSKVLSAEIGVRVVEENLRTARAVEALAIYLEKIEGSERRPPLPHQKIILNDILQGLYDGLQRGYVESPTSTGKTYLMVRLAEAFYDAGMRVLVLCDRHQQADQIIGKSGDTGLIQVTETMDLTDIAAHYGGARATPEDRVVVSTYASLNKFAADGSLGDFQAVIADEAHRGLGPITSANLINYSPGAIKAGFTATTAYSTEKKVSQIFDLPYHTTSLKEAIENDLVAPLHCLLYATDAEIPYLDKTIEYSQQELDKLISLRPRNDKAIEFAKDFVRAGRQGVIACVPGSNLAHARMLAADLDNDIVKLDDGTLKFIRARSVGGHQTAQQNREILESFESGYIDVITFVDLITEGWNSQVASFLIDLLPTTSRVKKTQKIGRILRKKPGNLESVFVDFMDISRKNQITSLDVLQERKFEIGRKFGPSTNGSAFDDSSQSVRGRNYIERILNSDLWFELQRIDSFKIADLRLRSGSGEVSEQDPLYAKYEQLLGAELRGEPENSMGVPASVIKELGSFIKRYAKLERIMPSISEVEEYIEEKMAAQRPFAFILATLALQGFDAQAGGLVQEDKRVPADDDVAEEVIYSDYLSTIDRCLKALPERERIIIKKRFGLYGHKPSTLQAIGYDLGLPRERVRQLEGQALSRLSILKEMYSIVG